MLFIVIIVGKKSFGNYSNAFYAESKSLKQQAIPANLLNN